MVLCFYNGTYQTLDIHLYGMFFFPHVSVYYINPNVYLLHVQLEMIHNILDLDKICVQMIFLIRMTHLYIGSNDNPSIIHYIL